MRPLEKIASQKSPREILAEDYKSTAELPIGGGWGYTKADACIINRNDSIVNQTIPFNGIAVEYAFVEKRIYEEMIIFRKDEDKFAGIKWKLMRQGLVLEPDHVYDNLEFNITAFSSADWKALKEEWEGPDGFCNPDFDQAAHERKPEQCMISIARDFWFDITSFYGK